MTTLRIVGLPLFAAVLGIAHSTAHGTEHSTEHGVEHSIVHDTEHSTEHGTADGLAPSSVQGVAQRQIIFSETFDSCKTGRLSCEGWSGDGSIEKLRGDNVLVLRVFAGDTLTSIRVPEGGFRVETGQSYRFSVAIRTDSLEADLSVGVWIEGGNGSEGPFAMSGVRETSSWHRMVVPFTPTMDGHVGITVIVANAGAECVTDNSLKQRQDTGRVPTTSGCGVVYVDDIVILPSPSPSPAGDPGFSNVCPEGQFANLAHSENRCEDLHVQLGDIDFSVRDRMRQQLHIDVETIFSARPSARLGFDHDLFESEFSAYAGNRFVVSGCNVSSIQSAILEGIEAGGGIISLPSCTIELDEPIMVSGAKNLVIEGQGIGRTRLVQHHRLRPGASIIIEKGKNVVIRDMSLHLNDLRYSNILIRRSTNVLVERILIQRAGSASIRSAHTNRITVRYSSIFRGPKSFNDPGCQGHVFAADHPSKSDRDGDGKGSTRECEMKWDNKWDENFETGSTWSTSYAAYSNITYENSFSLHATLGEVAGNRFFRVTGSKLSDAHYWWIHDNEFRENASGKGRTASFRTTSDGIVDRRAHHNVIYRNRFLDHVNPAIRIAGSDNYVIRNEYPTGNRTIKLMAGTSICEGSEEHTLLTRQQIDKGQFAILESNPGGICDLVSPGTIWSRVGTSSQE